MDGGGGTCHYSERGHPLLPTGVGGGVGGWSGCPLARNVPDRESLAVDRMTPYDGGAPDPHSRGGSSRQEWGSSVGEDTHSTPLHLSRHMWGGRGVRQVDGDTERPVRSTHGSRDMEWGGVGDPPLTCCHYSTCA